MLIVVVSDEPDVTERLDDVVSRLAARHDVMWAMVPDMPAVGAAGDEQDGVDVSSGRFVLGSTTLGARVVTAYRRAEQARTRRLGDFMTARAIPYATIGASRDIRPRLVQLTEVFARAG